MEDGPSGSGFDLLDGLSASGSGLDRLDGLSALSSGAATPIAAWQNPPAPDFALVLQLPAEPNAAPAAAPCALDDLTDASSMSRGGVRALPALAGPALKRARRVLVRHSVNLTLLDNHTNWVPAGNLAGFLGCIYKVWPAPGAREGLPNVGGFGHHISEGFPGPPGPGQTSKRHPQKPGQIAVRYPDLAPM
jgi:hypothetical protein